MLVEQVFGDIPESMRNSKIVYTHHRSSVSNSVNDYTSIPINKSKKEYEFLYNEISASKYQAFP